MNSKIQLYMWVSVKRLHYIQETRKGKENVSMKQRWVLISNSDDRILGCTIFLSSLTQQDTRTLSSFADFEGTMVVNNRRKPHEIGVSLKERQQVRWTQRTDTEWLHKSRDVKCSSWNFTKVHTMATSPTIPRMCPLCTPKRKHKHVDVVSNLLQWMSRATRSEVDNDDYSILAPIKTLLTTLINSIPPQRQACCGQW